MPKTSSSSPASDKSGDTSAESLCQFKPRREMRAPSELNEDARNLVSDWLKHNVEELYLTAKKELNVSDKIHMKKKFKSKVVKRVLENKEVQRFPSCATVSQAALAYLESHLKRHHRGQDANTSNRNVSRTGDGDPNGLVTDPFVKRKMKMVNARMPDADGKYQRYWNIIQSADRWENDPKELYNHLKKLSKKRYCQSRCECKQGKAKEKNSHNQSRCQMPYNNQERKDFLELMHPKQQKNKNRAVDVEPGEQGDLYKAAVEDMSNLQQKVWPELHKEDSVLLGASSLSHELAKRMTLVNCPDGTPKSQCMVKGSRPEDEFWKTRFLFSGKQRDSTFQGVALDTVLGKVWGAKADRKGDDVWKFRLEPVTNKRWKHYVFPQNYNLSAFDDDGNLCRFKPERVTIDCDKCHESFKKRHQNSP